MRQIAQEEYLVPHSPASNAGEPQPDVPEGGAPEYQGIYAPHSPWRDEVARIGEEAWVEETVDDEIVSFPTVLPSVEEADADLETDTGTEADPPTF